MSSIATFGRADAKSLQLQEYSVSDGVVIVSGFDQYAVDKLYEEAARFFDSPDRVKYRSASVGWGYSIEAARELEGGEGRERFDVQDINFLSPDRITLNPTSSAQLKLDSRPKGKWPTYRDFPGLQPSISEVYRLAGRTCRQLAEGALYEESVSVFKYGTSEAEFKITPHWDNDVTFYFKPIGEDLEVEVGSVWTPLVLERGQAVAIKPGIKHQVRNLTKQIRYSIVFGYR